MRVIVTGSSGFIGRHLCRLLLREGHTVLGVDRRAFVPPEGFGHDSVVADIRDGDELKRVFAQFRPEGVVHLAARTDFATRGGLEEYTDNTIGVRTLLEVMAATGGVRRAICASSQLVCHIGYKPKDDLDFRPTTTYGMSKVETERIWRSMNGANTEWCIVRPTSVWGPWMYAHYLRFFRMVQTGRYVHVGSRAATRSVGYVGNVAYQFLQLLTAPADRVHTRVFYLCDYTPVHNEEWAEAFRRALGAPKIRRIPLWLGRTAARVGDLVVLLGARGFPFTSFRLGNVLNDNIVNCEPTRAVCGELPFSTEQGVEQTVEWLKTALRDD